MTGVITFGHLSRYPHLKHAISTKSHGTMKKENTEVHHANVLKFIKSISTTSMGICMHQIHSGTVQIVENNRELVVSNADALITNKKNLALTVCVADCVPILLFDPVRNVIAAVHAGSKGLLLHIIENTIYAMRSVYNSIPNDLLVGIGPSICVKCYEVSNTFAQQYQNAFFDMDPVTIQIREKNYLDVQKLAVQILVKEGILEKNIERTTYCTSCDNAYFYSYRRGDTYERFAGSIALE